ncbi:hypothetical protein FRC17_002328 [Serendipita sp. 399]|nr:hypothetical protein FRC17_002328 [Serendipita sp. 399]
MNMENTPVHVIMLKGYYLPSRYHSSKASIKVDYFGGKLTKKPTSLVLVIHRDRSLAFDNKNLYQQAKERFHVGENARTEEAEPDAANDAAHAWFHPGSDQQYMPDFDQRQQEVELYLENVESGPTGPNQAPSLQEGGQEEDEQVGQEDNEEEAGEESNEEGGQFISEDAMDTNEDTTSPPTIPSLQLPPELAMINIGVQQLLGFVDEKYVYVCTVCRQSINSCIWDSIWKHCSKLCPGPPSDNADPTNAAEQDAEEWMEEDVQMDDEDDEDGGYRSHRRLAVEPPGLDHADDVDPSDRAESEMEELEEATEEKSKKSPLAHLSPKLLQISHNFVKDLQLCSQAFGVPIPVVRGLPGHGEPFLNI